MKQDFNELVTQYHRLVMSLIYRYYDGQLGDRADDLAQEVWARLWESFKKNERNIVSFKSYLYRTVQTTLWDAIRALEKDRQLQTIDESDFMQEVGDDKLHQRMALEGMLAALKPEEARLMRAHLKGFTTDEIATMLGFSEAKVRNSLSRLKKKLVAMGGFADASDT